jgi:hypothetical protein
MAYRPAQIYTGTGWDDIGDPRVGTVQTDVTNLQNGKLAYETPLTDQSGTTYTFVLADARRITRATNAAAKTFTIPPQTSVTWANNSIIRLVNSGAGALTVNGGSGVTVTNTAKTIGEYEAAAAIRTGSNAWTLVPFSGGVSNADFSNSATGTFTSGSDSFKYVTFTGNGTLTVTKSGLADVLVVAGGGSGGNRNLADRCQGGGGAGGVYLHQGVILPVGSLTVTIGGGGAGTSAASSAGNNGNLSELQSLPPSMGGGAGGVAQGSLAEKNFPPLGRAGGCSGGNAAYTDMSDNPVGFAVPGFGFRGGFAPNNATNSTGAGGGGGGGSVGGTGNTSVGGDGGSGFSTSFVGSTPTSSYTAGSFTVAGGGGGSRRSGSPGSGGSGGGTAGATTGTTSSAGANTGSGSGGAGTGSGNGGSGLVIVRVKTN